MADATQHRESSHWPLLRSLEGWQASHLKSDLLAGLTLAAIAIPEQMATARLAGFSPEQGLFVFVTGTLGFVLFGANRHLSSGADSTITPIFAGALGMLAAQGTPGYAGLAAALALAVGAILIASGLARLGWIANFLSVPVTTGFLAGIAVHIAVSQLPAALGLASPGGTLVMRFARLAMHLADANPYAVLLALLVFTIASAGDLYRWRVPGALVGLAFAMVAVGLFRGMDVTVVGATSVTWPRPALPVIGDRDLGGVATLAIVVAVVVMVQTAATTRAFASLADPQDVNRDFIGVGAGSVVSGFLGLFPANASPPRTAAVKEAGGRTQIAGLAAVAVVVAVATFGGALLRYVPHAALAGVLLAIAVRIVRLATIATVLRETPAEFALILVTAIAIVVLPIQTGVAVGIALSILQGMWTITRTRLIEFVKVPDTTLWWPPSADTRGETLAHVRVVAFQAPLFFLNADAFRSDMIGVIERESPRLIVLEASSVAEIDYTAAQVLIEIIARCEKAHIRFAIARMTSLRAQQALVRFGVAERLGPEGIFRTVDEAIRAHTVPPPNGVRGRGTA